MSNLLKFLRALKPGTILYDSTTNYLFISCGCKSYVYRFFFGLNLKTEVHGVPSPDSGVVKIELHGVHNLRNYTIIGNLK